MLDAIFTFVETIIWLPIVSVRTVFLWFMTAYETWPSIVVYFGLGLVGISFLLMTYVSYQELGRVNRLIVIKGTYILLVRTVRQYVRSVLMPITPRIPFIKQMIRNVTNDEIL